MKINWTVLAFVAVLSFFIPGGLLAASEDPSGAGMIGFVYVVLMLPPVALVAIVAQVLTINTRFRAYPAYVLTSIIASALGVLLLV